MGVILLTNGDYLSSLTEVPLQIAWMVSDSVIRNEQAPIEYLKLLEGEYLATNLPNGNRKISFKESKGELFGNDHDYKFRLIYMGEGKFINPVDGASLVFDTKDANA